MELLLSAKGISKSFQGRKVLDGINIEIKKSEIIAITGTSGVGKTTLLNILSTLDIPDDKSKSSKISSSISTVIIEHPPQYLTTTQIILYLV